MTDYDSRLVRFYKAQPFFWVLVAWFAIFPSRTEARTEGT